MEWTPIILKVAVGHAFKVAAGKLSTLSDPLDRALTRELEDWRLKLPKELYIQDASSLLDLSGDETSEQTQSTRLANELELFELPTVEQWHQALLDQWRRRKADLGRDGAAIFQCKTDEVREPLFELAKRLDAVCRQDEKLFRNTVLTLLQSQSASALRDEGRLDHRRPPPKWTPQAITAVTNSGKLPRLAEQPRGAKSFSIQVWSQPDILREHAPKKPAKSVFALSSWAEPSDEYFWEKSWTTVIMPAVIEITRSGPPTHLKAAALIATMPDVGFSKNALDFGFADMGTISLTHAWRHDYPRPEQARLPSVGSGDLVTFDETHIVAAPSNSWMWRRIAATGAPEARDLILTQDDQQLQAQIDSALSAIKAYFAIRDEDDEWALFAWNDAAKRFEQHPNVFAEPNPDFQES